MSGVVNSIANVTRTGYDLAFQVSPIILQGGIASGVPGGMLPIIGLASQIAGAALGAVTSGGVSPDDFFATYIPIPGATFINQSIGQYPFANQQVAANAVIVQPNTVSLLMLCPIKTDGGYLTKLPILMSLQAALKQHNALGGTYIVMTPGMIYTSGVMLGMTAVDSGESKQQMVRFQLDFWFPLITQAQAQQAQGNLMQAATNGSALSSSPSWSGVGSAVTAGLPF